jgi:RecG-like helicase
MRKGKVCHGEGAVTPAGAGRAACAPRTEMSRSLSDLDWIPRPRLLALRRLDIETVEDLLTHFPRRHEDRHEFPHFPR